MRISPARIKAKRSLSYLANSLDYLGLGIAPLCYLIVHYERMEAYERCSDIIQVLLVQKQQTIEQVRALMQEVKEDVNYRQKNSVTYAYLIVEELYDHL